VDFANPACAATALSALQGNRLLPAEIKMKLISCLIVQVSLENIS